MNKILKNIFFISLFVLLTSMTAHKFYVGIYQINHDEVFIHCILDGRREIQKLLQERLLRI